jgi:hypothetical protein
MPGLQRHTNFAIRLESRDAGTVTGARINNHKRPSRRIGFESSRWNNPDEGVIDRSLQSPSIDNELHLEIKHVRSKFGQLCAILITALAHDIEAQHASLRSVDQVFGRRREEAKLRFQLPARLSID